MKQLIKLIMGDIAEEGISKKETLIYGLLAYAAIVLFCCLAELINSL